MKVIDVREAWIHTHYILDSFELTEAERNEIKLRVEPELKQMGIQYGIHFDRKPHEDHMKVVLECIPFDHIKDRVKEILQETIRDFPTRARAERRDTVTRISVKEEEE
jgi:hypothetical protein